MHRPFFLLVATVLVSTCREKVVDPQELLTAQHLGLTDLRRGQLPQAEEQFKKVVELAPKDPLGYANLGLTYLRGGRYEEAEEQLEKARKLAPQNVDVGLIQARLYQATNRPADARRVLQELGGGRDPKALYALAELDTNAVERLRDALAAAPTNVAVRLKLVDALMRRNLPDSAAVHLEEIRRQRPEPPVEARPHLDSAVRSLRASPLRLDAARASFDAFMRYMEITSPYQAALEDVKWLEGPIVGRPVLAFNPQSLISTRGIIPVGRRTDVRFVDATSDAGFPVSQTAVSAVAIGDYDNDGTDDIFVSRLQPPASSLYHVQGGYVADVTERTQMPAALAAGAAFATFADVDNDGWLDLFAIGGDGRGVLLRNRGDATFENVTTPARVADVGGARKAKFFDADHDGDIDLLLIGDATRLLRNNLDGTFTDATTQIGLAGVGAARDAVFADFDDDGRVDVYFARSNGDVAFQSTFQGFRQAPAEWGALSTTSSTTAAVTDFDNDGWLDVLATSLWRKDGTRGFVRDTRSDAAMRAVGAAVAAEWIDYDNDGWSDLVAVGSSGARLIRNEGRGRFADRSSALPPLRAPSSLAATDIDGDGDQDLVVGDASGVHLLRNDGGNVRMAMQVQLVGLRAGSGKNNTFGVGSKISVRASEIFQTRVVTNRITHFGLGSHLKADVVRVQWTNGVPETIYFPGTDADILELEQLKGSCAFLYTWDGTRFRFVTDVMWQSALGMPVGLMAGGDKAFAPAGASREYLRVPGDVLRPKDGKYVLQVTEELWETAFLDEIKLLAVDHPDSVEIFVDERFPPMVAELRMSHLVNRRPLVSATDESGRDLLPTLREKDDVYVGDFRSDRYQGVVASHDLILDLGAEAGRANTQLVLRGWIYPSDASINVALSQQSALKTSMPSLEVRNARGQWQTVIPAIGFPSGKDKTVILDLTGKFPTNDRRVRIRTNMAIYWDQAFVATHAPAAEVRTTTLAALSGDLHFRGYSRMYRKGGKNGPHWFDYDSVAKDSPWRTITGSFTRFGNVLPLLGASDDMYVVMAPGDEATIQFDASSESAIPKGWKRTFLLYTDGWIKDADLNTAYGQTVEPLPFHGNKSYPYEAGESYPSDSARNTYRRTYNTRVVRR